VVPVSFKNLILPDKYPAPTILNTQLKPKLVAELGFDEVEQVYAADGLKEFSQVQT